MSYCSIAEHFSRYFQLIVADTPELKREVYSIRYQVYCEELNYESADKFPEGLEQDAYDDHSIHYLLKHKPSGLYAGCVRTVLPRAINRQTTLPSETLFPENFDLIDKSGRGLCEASRVAVLSEFRKPKTDNQKSKGIFFAPTKNYIAQANKTSIPLIALSLYWVSIGTGPFLNLDVLALMEPRLSRHLQRYGILSERVGNLVEHRGKRGLFLIQPRKFVSHLKADVRELFDFIDTERKTLLSKTSAKQQGIINLSTHIESKYYPALESLDKLPIPAYF